ncbi:MAG: MFS transporter [Candidatus Lokiarchaeota archaeon]|nr:MFS transporter [Candidatus Lokiarchaeota archaeon]MBD3343221.1 MFS transporter [Candidatus Lokiarchaeota archaeon]
MSETEKQEKLDIRLTFLIGFAFFCTQISWSLYNAQVPISLLAYIGSVAIVGLIMGLDNLIGVFVQPLMGNVSDNTRTKWGRRMPYIIIGIPVSAIFFALIAFETSLFSLLFFMLCFIIAMSFYRSQTVALMPDFIQPQHRSKANSIINMMSAISLVAASLISIFLVDISLQLAFITVSVIMVIALIVLVLTVKEKNAYSYQAILREETEIIEELRKDKEKVGLVASFKDVLEEEDKSTLFMLFAIFFISVGWAALNALVSAYGINVLGLTRGQAGGLMLYGAITFLVFAFPLAVLAEKYGRRLFIKIGLFIFSVCLIIGFFTPNVLIVSILIALIGVGYACIIVNTIVIIWGLAPSERKIGTYTGMYYLFTFSAEIFGPALVGLLTDLTGWDYFFLNGALFLIMALILMFFVKREEADLTEEQRLAKKEALQKL